MGVQSGRLHLHPFFVKNALSGVKKNLYIISPKRQSGGLQGVYLTPDRRKIAPCLHFGILSFRHWIDYECYHLTVMKWLSLLLWKSFFGLGRHQRSPMNIQEPLAICSTGNWVFTKERFFALHPFFLRIILLVILFLHLAWFTQLWQIHYTLLRNRSLGRTLPNHKRQHCGMF